MTFNSFAAQNSFKCSAKSIVIDDKLFKLLTRKFHRNPHPSHIERHKCLSKSVANSLKSLIFRQGKDYCFEFSFFSPIYRILTHREIHFQIEFSVKRKFNNDAEHYSQCQQTHTHTHFINLTNLLNMRRVCCSAIKLQPHQSHYIG